MKHIISLTPYTGVEICSCGKLAQDCLVTRRAVDQSRSAAAQLSTRMIARLYLAFNKRSPSGGITFVVRATSRDEACHKILADLLPLNPSFNMAIVRAIYRILPVEKNLL